MKKLLLLFAVALIAVCARAEGGVWTYNVETDYTSASWKNVNSSGTSIKRTAGSGSIESVTWRSDFSGTPTKNGNTPKGLTYGSANKPPTVTFTTEGFAGKIITAVKVSIASTGAKYRFSVSCTNGSLSQTQEDVLYANGNGAADTQEEAQFTPDNIGDELSLTVADAGEKNNQGGFKLVEISVTWEDVPVGQIDYKPVFDPIVVEVEEVVEIEVKSDNSNGRTPPAITYSADDNDNVFIYENEFMCGEPWTGYITASWEEVEGVWNAGSVEIPVTVTGPAEPQDYLPVFNNVTLFVGGEYTISVASDNAEGNAPEITYATESGTEDVIAIDGDYMLACDAGTETVVATWGEVKGRWKAGSASFTVTVKQDPTTMTFVLVKDAAQLVAGDVYVIAHNTSSESKAASTAVISEKGSKVSGVDVTINGEILTPSDETMVFELGAGTGNTWSLKALNYKGTGTYLHFEKGSSTNLSFNATPTDYSIDFNNSYDVSIAATTGSGTQRYIGFNSGNFGAYVASYLTGMRLYKEYKQAREEYHPVFKDVQVEVGGEAMIELASDNSIAGIKEAPVLSYEIDGIDNPAVSIEGANVKGLAPGEASVKVSWEESEDWTAGSLLVPVQVTAREFRPQFDDMELTVYEDKDITFIYNTEAGVAAPAIHYTVPAEFAEIISIDQDASDQASVHALKIGEAKVTAIWGDENGWATGSAEFTVKVNGIEASMQWSADRVTVLDGEEFVAPRLEVYPEEYAANVQFSTSNAAVATVSETGEISIVGLGSADITATLPAGIFASEAAKVYISVVDPDLAEATFTFTEPGCYGFNTKDSFGNEEYSTDNPTLDENGIAVHIEGKYRSMKNSDNGYDLRVYSPSTVTLAAPAGFELKTITFHRNDSKNSGGAFNAKTVSAGTLDKLEWTITEPEWCEEVTFTVSSAIWLTGIDVTVAPLPEADFPNLAIEPDASAINFTAVHPSHTLMWRTMPAADEYGLRAPARAADAEGETDAEGWTSAASHQLTHTIDRTADDFEPYVLQVKAVDRRNRESAPLEFVVRESGVITGINGMLTDLTETEAEYYNLQGMRLPCRPAQGVYLERRGTRVTKQIAR